MPSTTPLTDAINALTTYANETTGASDTDLSSAVATLVAGYVGGGGMGGLANMKDVSSQDYQFAYMLSQMKSGHTAGGTVTYAEAFPNSETKILETGLTAIHGFIFATVDTSISTNTGNAQSGKFILVTVNSDTTYNFYGVQAASNAGGQKYAVSQGAVETSAPLNGALRFSGGDIYYTARYNKNANYQIVVPNKEYDWLAW